MRSQEYYEVDTAGGPVYVRPVNSSNMMISTSGGGGDPHFDLTVHGVEYKATLHLVRNLDKEGEPWELFRDKDGRTWHALYISRSRLSKNGRLEDPSSAATKKATAILLDAARTWAKDHEREIQEAELDDIETDIQRADSDIEKLEAQLADARERKNHLIIRRGLTQEWLKR